MEATEIQDDPSRYSWLSWWFLSLSAKGDGALTTSTIQQWSFIHTASTWHPLNTSARALVTDPPKETGSVGTGPDPALFLL